MMSVRLLFIIIGTSFGLYEWSWNGGPSKPNNPPSITSPGGRRSPLLWSNNNQKLWIFGGEGIDGSNTEVLLGDLWMSEDNGISWRLLSGSTSGNQVGKYQTQGGYPGSRTEAAHWMDASGNLWLFGGFGFDNVSSGFLNDLWMWDTKAGGWTFVGGSPTVNSHGSFGTILHPSPTNVPSARRSVGTSDSNGVAWIFGGNGFDSLGTLANLNDLWRFDGKVWTWMSGSSSAPSAVGAPNDYGTKGVPAPANTPGGRTEIGMWIDANNNVWLFGGETSEQTWDRYYNDIWMFNPTTALWVWAEGPSLSNQGGVYLDQGMPSTTSTPGARSQQCIVVDAKGVVWLFGGFFNSQGDSTGSYFNDLWSFNTTTSQWTWVTGNSTINQVGRYGSLGQPSPGNTPGARREQSCWTGGQNLYMFGGYGVSSDEIGVYFDDVWQLSPVDSNSPSALPRSNNGAVVAIVVIVVVIVVAAIVGVLVYVWIRRKRSFNELQEEELAS